MSVSARAVALMAGCYACAAHPQSIDEALRAAFTSSPALLAERLTLEQTREHRVQARAGIEPSVRLSAGGGYVHDQVSGVEAAGIAQSGQVGSKSFDVAIVQPLFHGGAVSLIKQADNAIQAEEAHVSSVEQKVILQAATDYLNLAGDQENMRLAQEKVETMHEEAKAAQAKLAAHSASRLDLAQSEAAYAESAAQLEQALGKLSASESAFVRDVGIKPSEVAIPKKTLQLPEDLAGVFDAVRENNPDVQSARYMLDASEQALRVARRQVFPRVDLQGDFQHLDDATYEGQRETIRSVTVQVQVPLYSGGSLSSKIREAEDAVAIQRAQLNAAQRIAESLGESAWQQMQHARESIRSYQSQIHADELALEGVRHQLEAGLRVKLDVLNAEEAVFRSRVNLIQAEHDELAAEYQLASATGCLTGLMLGLDNR